MPDLSHLPPVPDEPMRPVPGYEGVYSITPDGRMWMHSRILVYDTHDFEIAGLWKKPHVTAKGYWRYAVQDGDKVRTLRVHRLVASAYIPNPDDLPEVNHINGDKANNHVSNLEWATRKKNMAHAHQTGLIKRKLDPDKVREIRRRRANGEERDVLAAEFGVRAEAIRRAVRRETWAHVE